MYSNSVIELIKLRRSWRTFLPRKIEEEKIHQLQEFMDSAKGVYGTPLNLKFVHHTGDEKVGTYGTIKGAPLYLAGSIRKSLSYPEEYGYAFEKIILKAEELGLGSCWLGGTFSKGTFAKALSLKDVEILPAVTPLGYTASRRSFTDTVTVSMARSRSRLDWQKLFFQKNFSTPLTRENSGKYQISLEMVRLAPSASNKQPWRILKDGEIYHFYTHRSRLYNNLLRVGGLADLQRLDIGIAMVHFELSARESGLDGKWHQRNPGIHSDRNTEYISSWDGETE